MLQLLGQVLPNLPYLYSTFHLDYPLILSSVTVWWTSESPRAHVAKFYGRLRLIRIILRASKFAVLKFIEIVILWVYYTIPLGFQLV